MKKAFKIFSNPEMKENDYIYTGNVENCPDNEIQA